MKTSRQEDFVEFVQFALYISLRHRTTFNCLLPAELGSVAPCEFLTSNSLSLLLTSIVNLLQGQTMFRFSHPIMLPLILFTSWVVYAADWGERYDPIDPPVATSSAKGKAEVLEFFGTVVPIAIGWS